MGKHTHHYFASLYICIYILKTRQTTQLLPHWKKCLFLLQKNMPSCLKFTVFFHFLSLFKIDLFLFLLYAILKMYFITWKLFYFITTPKFLVRLRRQIEILLTWRRWGILFTLGVCWWQENNSFLLLKLPSFTISLTTSESHAGTHKYIYTVARQISD